MTLRTVIITLILCFGIMVAKGQTQSPQKNSPEYSFDKLYGQVEVGGRYAGAEFHDSRPLPSRISFYYPVANSIDLSTDYWKRGDSQPMIVGIQIGKGERRWIGREPWPYIVSPHKVVFQQRESEIGHSIKYEFCLNEPALIRTITLKNVTNKLLTVSAFTYLKPTLRTCQTYASKEAVRTSSDSHLNLLRFDFDAPETDSASLFVQNVGLLPTAWISDAMLSLESDSVISGWLSSAVILSGISIKSEEHVPVAAFEYQRDIKPGDSVSIIQIIGSCKRDEVEKISQRLDSSWKKEVRSYDEFVVKNSQRESKFITHDPVLDASAVWAKGILAANAHYINGEIVPMPCPAEYNFFFTHDVMMTDLGAVNFDLPRVKKDLLYVASLAKDNIIPHAYYWRDDGFKTEYCTPDNWNHFWFILASGSYLRHSLDEVTVRQLYPLVTKSLEELLTQVKSDHLMYAFRPDWWDIGHIEGPRAYTTILSIRSLREYLFISSFLGNRSPKLNEYEAIADSMQQALVLRLWDDQMKYLTNYNGDKKDEHYYMGSLLAVAYNLLDDDKAHQLLTTASEKLLDPPIGLRTAMPPDFHTKESIEFYKFAGEEAGRAYFYINGGVWPHDNSWYAIALNAIGQTDSALQFVKRTMTLDGIVHSPLGQPAMYEYRYTDPASKDYGMIDKPSFLWAGGFYLKTLYALFGARENEWNLSFGGSLPLDHKSVSYTFTLDKTKDVAISGKGNYLVSMTCNNTSIPSQVLPIDDARKAKSLTVKFGKAKKPHLKSINAIVDNITMDKFNGLHLEIRSFDGHKITAYVVAPSKIKSVEVDGVSISTFHSEQQADGLYTGEIHFNGIDNTQKVHIKY
jgi:hypothetical protein